MIRYGEVCDPGYNFDSESGAGGAGHFTQVVWKGSTVLGIGRAEVKQNGMLCAYIVGRYKKAGNFIGKFKENVEKGSFRKSMCEDLDKAIAVLRQGKCN